MLAIPVRDRCEPRTWMGKPVRDDLVEILLKLSADLQLKLSAYVLDHRLPIEKMLRVDLAVALLRIDTAEARLIAQELTGCAIQVCPSGLPPWPPKPVAARHAKQAAKVASVADNPCQPSTDAHRRFALVRKGSTKEQLKSRGVTQRDIDRWTKKNWVVWT